MRINRFHFWRFPTLFIMEIKRNLKDFEENLRDSRKSTKNAKEFQESHQNLADFEGFLRFLKEVGDFGSNSKDFHDILAIYS